MVLTTDAVDQKTYPDNPYKLAVRPVYGGKFYEVFLLNGGRFLPNCCEGRFSTEGDAKHAILTYYKQTEQRRLFRPSGLPRPFPRRKDGDKAVEWRVHRLKGNKKWRKQSK